MFVNKFISDKLGLCDIEKVNDCCCTNSTCTAYVDQQTETDLWQEYNIWFITGLVVVVLIISIGILYLYKKQSVKKKNNELTYLKMKPTNKQQQLTDYSM
eukprot:260733_1